jgi:hypothetical protein
MDASSVLEKRPTVRRDVRRLYAAGSRLEMLEAAFELDRAKLLMLLRHPGRWDSYAEQQRIDANLARDGVLAEDTEPAAAD